MSKTELFKKMVVLAKAQAISHYFCDVGYDTLAEAAQSYDVFETFVGSLPDDKATNGDYGSLVDKMFGEDGEVGKAEPDPPAYLPRTVWEPHENASPEELSDMVSGMMRSLLRNAGELGIIDYTE